MILKISSKLIEIDENLMKSIHFVSKEQLNLPVEFHNAMPQRGFEESNTKFIYSS